VLRKIYPSALFLLLSVFTGVFFSCTKECPEGFSGKDCEVRVSDAFLGSYEGYVNCGLTDQFTAVDIYRATGPFDIRVDFVSTPDFILEASVHDDSIYFPDQWLGVPQGQDTVYYIIFESTGVLNADTLDFDISILYPGQSDPEKIVCTYSIIK
jgi:hypothetical protein